MSAKRGSSGGGFQSAAGLMRYFDEEDSKGPKIDHRIVLGIAIGMIVIVEILKWQWPM